MSKRNDNDLIYDMYEALHRIKTYIDTMSYETFSQDTRTQDAVIRNLEIIGEATKQLSETVRTRHPDIPWRSMAGMRDCLIHDDSGVNLDIVWLVVNQDLPVLLQSVAAMLEDS